MSKRMTERLFADSHLHQAVLNECSKQIVLEGEFRKLDIMIAVGDTAMIDAVRWDWIVRKLVDTLKLLGGVILIPVAESFFRADAKKKAAMQTDYKFKHEDSFPGKYVAQGYGKRTAGWVLGTFADGRFALYRANLMKAASDGKRRKLEAFAKRAVQALPDGNTKAAEIAQVAGIASIVKGPVTEQ